MTKSPAMASEATETSPLLTPPPELDETYGQQQKSTRWKWQTPQVTTWLVLLAILLGSFAEKLCESPFQRIFESVICYRYYEEHDPSKLVLGRDQVGPGAIGGVPESLCKIDTVQNELAALNGWQQLFDGIPSLLLSIPFGWIGDKYGRKVVVTLTLVAYCLRLIWTSVVPWFWQSLDIRMVWLSTLPFLFSGGPMILTTMIYVVLSDITPAPERAAVFLRLSAFNLLASLLMPPLASLLMERDPWIPTIIASGLMILTTVLYFFVPETLHMRHLVSHSNDIVIEEEVELPPPNYIPVQQHTWYHFLHRQRTVLKTTTSFLVDDWRIPALLPTFLPHVLLTVCAPLLLQFLSKRYTLSFAQATLVSTIRSAVIVLLLFVLLPLASKLLMRVFQLSGLQKDLYLARASLFLAAIGWISASVAPNVPLFAVGLTIASLGQGSNTFVRAFVTALTPANSVALLFSIITTTDTLAIMAGAPLMAWMFKFGSRVGPVWSGLPFTFVGLLALASGVGIALPVWIRKGRDEALYRPLSRDDDGAGDDEATPLRETEGLS